MIFLQWFHKHFTIMSFIVSATLGEETLIKPCMSVIEENFGFLGGSVNLYDSTIKSCKFPM